MDRNENRFRFHPGMVLHDMIEQFIFSLSLSHKKEMGSEKHRSDVVLPVREKSKLEIRLLHYINRRNR